MSVAVAVGTISFPCGKAYGDDNIVKINNAKELSDFAKKCIIDSYSRNLTVVLENDIDLKGSDFICIPYFSGVFDGNHKTVTNFKIKDKGSNKGFIRFTSKEAVVKNLTVDGNINPDGSRTNIGGIVGNNQGIISCCNFFGEIDADEAAGGITGINNGLITECVNEGNVIGEHKIGGITGYNTGVIDRCNNNGKINTEIVLTDNVGYSRLSLGNFDISEVSEDDFYNISDLGGIAGLSEGDILECCNNNTIGYEKMGYNVGGIAGRQNGRISDCTNKGEIYGRKDVGGIAGQIEPYTTWDFSDSKLKELEDTINEINSNIDKLRNDAANSSDEVKNQIKVLQDSVDTTSNDLKYAVGQMTDNVYTYRNTANQLITEIRSGIDSHDELKVTELVNNLNETLENQDENVDVEDILDILKRVREEKIGGDELYDKIEKIIAHTDYNRPDTEKVFNDVDNVTNGVRGIESLLASDSELIRNDTRNVIESIEKLKDAFTVTAQNLSDVNTDYEKDISAENVDRYNKGIVKKCKNFGRASGDTNVGGISGTVSYEVSFDAEDKIKVSDYLLTNAKYLVYAVIEECENASDITAYKENAGGITGNADFGIILKSIGSGTISAGEGDYCGGVAGLSNGNIKDSYSRALLHGSKYVGGVAGKGYNIYNCKSYSFLKDRNEYYGCIAGDISGNVSGCYYVESDDGGVDGIGYTGKAEPVTYEKLLTFADIPDVFKKITVTFIANDETVEVKEVEFGKGIDSFPEVPMMGTKYWKWDDFDNEHIYYSLTVEGEYKNPTTTIATTEKIAAYLVEGNFYEGQKLTAKSYKPEMLAEFGKGKCINSGKLSVNGYDGEFKVRMKSPDDGILFVSDDSKSFEETKYERDGSYIVFTANNGCYIVYMENVRTTIRPYVITGLIILAVIIFAIVINVRNKKQKNISDSEDTESLKEDSEKQ